jgi:NADPH:quinone reductase-like Zn-dependent oxidoreductase
MKYVRELGAANVIDYRAQHFEQEVKEIDAVLDLVGGDTQARSFAVLRDDGTLISTVSQPDQQRPRIAKWLRSSFLSLSGKVELYRRAHRLQ